MSPDPALESEGGVVFTFNVSSDINSQVQLRVDKLVGCIPAYRDVEIAPGGSVRPSALHVVAQLCEGGDVLAIPARTHYAEADFDGCSWDTWLAFPVKYRDLGPAAQMALTVWEVREGGSGPGPLGGTTFRLFSKKGRLKGGAQSLRLWAGVPADVRCPTCTPGKVPVAQRGESGRVERVLKRYHRGELESVPWLDRLAVRAANEVLAGEAASAAAAGDEASQRLLLDVELPSFPGVVLYHQATLFTGAASSVAGGQSASAASTGAALSTPLPGTAGTGVFPAASAWGGGRPGGVIQLLDPEVGRDSPAELKAQKLARSAGRGVVDSGLRPNTAEQARIEAVLALPPGRPLPPDDRELLWRFRFTLTSDGRALTRFLKCVDWGDAAEAAQAGERMAKWASIGVADALELLSPDYPVEAVRAHAVAALRGTSDEELLCYLLQLVQALRYEPGDDSRLARFLLERARRSAAVASALFWYLCAELDDPTFGERAAQVQKLLLRPAGGRLGSSPPSSSALSATSDDGSGSVPEDCIPLQLNLVARLRHLADAVRSARSAERKTEAMRAMMAPGEACADLTTFACPCPLDPAVTLLGILPSGCSVFRSKVNPLKVTFRARLPGGGGGSGSFEGGGRAGSPGSAGGSSIVSEGISRMASLTLSSQLQGGTPARGPSSPPASPRRDSPGTSAIRQPGPPSPSSPTAPLPPTATVTLIYKRGDDLRQDQLVLQMISLMDRLLKREHLDLRITAYQVLPTSSYDGLIEFVPDSLPLSQVLRDHATIHRFLTRHHPDPRGPYGLDPGVLSNFVRSTAGYTVLTHILGVGDRHMDNVMLTTGGRLFHIDFGYFLGRDPKFSSAPLVLNRAMVDGMGGVEGAPYRQFLQLCGEAFNILRKAANLLLSLLHLMAGSSIPDIRADPEKALLKVQERLRLDLSDEEAAALMEQMLAAAQAAVLPRMAEVQHRVAQGFR